MSIVVEVPPLELKPEKGRTEPRLWVQRLVIWRDPDHIIQDISLKCGLNIIWSPDYLAEDEGMAHGSGKTTFCRLMRYCLGEANFAQDEQQRSMRERFPQGAVGAEVMVDGRLWSVIRDFRNHDHDVVIAGRSLDDAVRRAETPTGISLLTNEISRVILGDSPQLMPLCLGEARAWDAALAFVARDQECRCIHHLEWRHEDSYSGSPVRGMSRENHVLVLRALIKSLSIKEVELLQETTNGTAQYEREKKLLEVCDAVIERDYKELLLNLKMKFTLPIDAEPLERQARVLLLKARKLPDPSVAIRLDDARLKCEQAQNQFSQAEMALNENSIRINEKEKRLVKLNAVAIEANDCSMKDQNANCPACGILLNDAIAGGCADYLDHRQARLNKRVEDIKEEDGEIEILKLKQPTLEEDAALARQKLDTLTEEVISLTSEVSSHQAKVLEAEMNHLQAKLLNGRIQKRAMQKDSLDEIEWRNTKPRDALAAERKDGGHSVRRLSIWFDTILHELVRGKLEGKVKIAGDKLNIEVRLDGKRTSTALKTLEVIAFDLAALIMSIEGDTCLPGFLMHDSPREGDLSDTIYARLFQTAKKLEKVSSTPLFQYIVTTTTAPPEEFRIEPWLRLTLCGNPAEKRLLKEDL